MFGFDFDGDGKVGFLDTMATFSILEDVEERAYRKAIQKELKAIEKQNSKKQSNGTTWLVLIAVIAIFLFLMLA